MFKTLGLLVLLNASDAYVFQFVSNMYHIKFISLLKKCNPTQWKFHMEVKYIHVNIFPS